MPDIKISQDPTFSSVYFLFIRYLLLLFWLIFGYGMILLLLANICWMIAILRPSLWYLASIILLNIHHFKIDTILLHRYYYLEITGGKMKTEILKNFYIASKW